MQLILNGVSSVSIRTCIEYLEVIDMKFDGAFDKELWSELASRKLAGIECLFLPKAP